MFKSKDRVEGGGKAGERVKLKGKGRLKGGKEMERDRKEEKGIEKERKG